MLIFNLEWRDRLRQSQKNKSNKERGCVCVSTKARQKFEGYAKVGVIKQLYKDNLITDTQFQHLMRKYGAENPKPLQPKIKPSS